LRKKSAFKRSAGVLLHISSLPGPDGIGSIGSEAVRFIDALAKGGQSYWQILPLTTTGYGDSPYQSFSCAAGNPYLISLEELEKDGLLLPGERSSVNFGDSVDFVEYG